MTKISGNITQLDISGNITQLSVLGTLTEAPSYWYSYWMDQDVFDFLWWNSAPVGNELVDISGNGNNITITGKDFSTNYIPATSAATFQIPNDAGLLIDDEDYLWHDFDDSLKNVTVVQLIGYDFSRTFIKYDNASPHHIKFIAIIKSSTEITQEIKDKLSQNFELWMFYFGTQNDYGYAKENRPAPNWNPLPTFLNDANHRFVYDYWEGITDVGGGKVSIWADFLAGANSLLQATGAKRPIIDLDGSLDGDGILDDGVLFDGVDDFLKTAAFTWVRPEFIYLVIKQINWTDNDRFCDGNTFDTGLIWQNGTIPGIMGYAGQNSSASNDLIVGKWGIVRVLFDNPAGNSKMIVNDNTPITGNFGTNQMGGFTLGSRATGLFCSNIKVKGVIGRGSADQETAIYTYLKWRYEL